MLYEFRSGEMLVVEEMGFAGGRAAWSALPHPPIHTKETHTSVSFRSRLWDGEAQGLQGDASILSISHPDL